MAVDTEARRASLLGLLLPDGTIDAADRRTLALIYLPATTLPVAAPGLFWREGYWPAGYWATGYWSEPAGAVAILILTTRTAAGDGVTLGGSTDATMAGGIG